ncbi:cytosolic sulfotransferase 5-like [Humulus lupulus]|uniref:cytosolic sulfotransferase 5-like n=1 Tax=Humulus lupulus TaxID=3486 RepID=UPI002B4134CF|nr:cytosolic sulfotransferase 5-like [Humulus lupulus]
MAEESTQYFSNSSGNKNDEDDNDEYSLESVISELPKASGWSKNGICLYQNCWFPSNIIPNIISFQKQFKAKAKDEDEDMIIILASFQKSGTTWLKSLLFSILNRSQHCSEHHPLLTTTPQVLVPSFEFTIYNSDPRLMLNTDSLSSTMPSSPRRSMSTHIPYASLPRSITQHCSNHSRIVYISRNPLDVIVSLWHFARAHPDRHSHELTVGDFVDMFCSGEINFGPYWDHVLGYWKASLERPEKVLFLKYEDLKEDGVGQAKRVAEFVGVPFSREEESGGVVEQVLEMCSFGKLKDLDVNKHGQFKPNLDNKIFFRKGQVGDWVNHLTPSMADRVNEIIKEKFSGSGLSFRNMS